jgi:hypothetical protein
MHGRIHNSSNIGCLADQVNNMTAGLVERCSNSVQVGVVVLDRCVARLSKGYECTFGPVEDLFERRGDVDGWQLWKLCREVHGWLPPAATVALSGKRP